MPRHEFRTIEAFVHSLEEKAAGYLRHADLPSAVEGKLFLQGRAYELGLILEILRNSNLGIVYPPEAEVKSLLRWFWHGGARTCSDCSGEVFSLEEGYICSKCKRQADT